MEPAILWPTSWDILSSLDVAAKNKDVELTATIEKDVKECVQWVSRDLDNEIREQIKDNDGGALVVIVTEKFLITANVSARLGS